MDNVASSYSLPFPPPHANFMASLSLFYIAQRVLLAFPIKAWVWGTPLVHQQAIKGHFPKEEWLPPSQQQSDSSSSLSKGGVLLAPCPFLGGTFTQLAPVLVTTAVSAHMREACCVQKTVPLQPSPASDTFICFYSFLPWYSANWLTMAICFIYTRECFSAVKRIEIMMAADTVGRSYSQLLWARGKPHRQRLAWEPPFQAFYFVYAWNPGG